MVVFIVRNKKKSFFLEKYFNSRYRKNGTEFFGGIYSMGLTVNGVSGVSAICFYQWSAEKSIQSMLDFSFSSYCFLLDDNYILYI